MNELSPEQRFNGLGEEFWRQYLDRQNDPFGFDKGKNGEPGYFNGICKAHNLALLHLNDPINLELYKAIHAQACAHFDGKSTLMTAEKTGKFYVDENSIEQTTHVLALAPFQDRTTNSPKKLIPERNNQIVEDGKKIGAQYPIARIYLGYKKNSIFILHRRSSEAELELIVSNLFADFNKKMENTELSSEEKINHIAKLYQTLGWIHPFMDGQGRTDLVLLAKLLTQHGLTPAILDDPYISLFCSIEDWVQYLKEGMKKWQTEWAHPTHPTEKEDV